MKRIFALLFAAALSLSLITPAFAASEEAINAADNLYELGLFSGTGTNADGTPIYDLDRAPTRHEAVTMLVGLLGKKDEALSGTWDIPFTDVADWAKPFVGYAYTNGLTSGTSATTFGGNDLISAAQYLTFVLKVLGYEAGTDFQWNKAWELSDHIGLTNFGEYGADSTFTRGDVAILSLRTYQLQKTLETAPYWGLSEDIHWISHPTTPEDVTHNILYSFLIGNYELNFPRETGWLHKEKINIQDLSHVYPDLMGAYANFDTTQYINTTLTPGRPLTSTKYEKRGVSPSLSTQEIYGNQLAALDKALEIKASLHNSGKITNGMSELQIAKVYYGYLSKLRLSSSGGRTAAAQGKSVEYDTAYACLVNQSADCVGRAAAFNLLMHVEGISAQGVAGSIKGTDSGHVLSRVVLDGTEYFCNWGSGNSGIYRDITSWFIFEEDSLAMARAAG